MLIIKTPNQDSLVSLACRLLYSITFGRYLLPIYGHEHLYRFSGATLSLLLAKAGYDTVSIDLEDDLRIMGTRVLFGRRLRPLWLAAMWAVHLGAKVLRRENQIIAYARRD
jgi:hypothetical protein